MCPPCSPTAKLCVFMYELELKITFKTHLLGHTDQADVSSRLKGRLTETRSREYENVQLPNYYKLSFPVSAVNDVLHNSRNKSNPQHHMLTWRMWLFLTLSRPCNLQVSRRWWTIVVFPPVSLHSGSEASQSRKTVSLHNVQIRILATVKQY